MHNTNRNPNAARAQAYAEGYAAGRKDAVAIMSLEEAKGREGLAAELAGDAAVDLEKAKAWLAKTPAPEARASRVAELSDIAKRAIT